MNNSSGVIQDLDDAALADKMRKAQERLEGLDKHVADLRSRSVEQDALAKGKLSSRADRGVPGAGQVALEIKRRELLERQMGVGEELQRVATTNGTLNNHRHGGTPRAQKENARRELVDRLRREEAAAQARLEAYKGGSFGAEAEAAHRTTPSPASRRPRRRPRRSASANGRPRSAEGARRNLRRLLPRSPTATIPTRPARSSHNARPDRSHDAQPDRSHDAQPHFHDQPPPQYPYQQTPPPTRARRVSTGNALRPPPYGMGPGMGPMNPMGPMHPMAMDRTSPRRRRGAALRREWALRGRALRRGSFRERGRDDERGDGRRREPPATPDYAAKLRAQVDELQKSLASLLAWRNAAAAGSAATRW